MQQNGITIIVLQNMLCTFQVSAYTPFYSIDGIDIGYLISYIKGIGGSYYEPKDVSYDTRNPL